MYQGIYELLENNFTLFPRSPSANLFKNTVSFSLCLAFSLELAAFNSVTWEIYFLTLFFGNCPFLEICGKSSGEKCEVFSKRETNFDWNHFSNLNFITVFFRICQRFFLASRFDVTESSKALPGLSYTCTNFFRINKWTGLLLENWLFLDFLLETDFFGESESILMVKFQCYCIY